MSWKKIKLGDILTESKIVSENPNPNRRITVRLKVLGVEKRGIENEVAGATKQYIRRAGQFIYGKQNFHKGAFGIVPPELDGFESSSDLPAFDVDKSCLPEFVFYFFKQGNFYLELSKIASGVATQRINTTQLFELELLLPDIKTQRLLISNIQLLEKNGLDISIELTHQLTLVKKLRHQLLQDAVQGKLVGQNKNDEQASELLKKIKAEKEKLIAEKKLKKEKELTPIKPEEIPFEIPENWVWCRLGEIAEIGTGATPLTSNSDYYENGKIPWITSSATNNLFVDEPELYITEKALKETNCKVFPVGTLVVAMYGQGKTRGQITELNFPAATNQACATITLFFNEITLRKYIKLFFQKIYNEIRELAQGGAQPNLNMGKVRDTIIPFPPLAEQNRIVQKLYELMNYCNELEVSIKQSESQNEKLLHQVLREALRKEPVGV
jgi:type I restriction enzyme S subunit